MDVLGKFISGMAAITFVGCPIITAIGESYTHGYCTADEAGYVAEHLIKDRLEFPDAAKFVYGSDDHVYVKDECKFTVTGHVDGESVLGIKRRAAWIASFVIDKEGGTAKSVDYVNIN